MKQTDTLLNGFKIIQDPQKFMFGIDAVLLSNFVLHSNGDSSNIHKNQNMIDLGTGTGIVPLLLEPFFQKKNLSKTSDLITGLEIQAESAQMAQESISLNNLENSIRIVNDDIKNVSSVFDKHSFDIVTSNPPYMAVTQGKNNSFDAKTIARHEIFCNLEDVIFAADYLLKSHGRFFMIHKPERLSEIFVLFSKYKLEPKILQLVIPYSEKEPTMILIEARKNASSGLKILPSITVYENSINPSTKNRNYTQKVQDIYNNFKI